MAPSDQKTMNKRDETWKVLFLRIGGGWGLVCGQRATVCRPSSTSCSRQQLPVPQFHFSCHCFVITASALALCAFSEGVASSAASECVFSVASAGHVQSKNKEGDFFFFATLLQLRTAETLLFFSNSALMIRSSLLVAIRGWERLTPIMLLSKKSALLIRPNEIIKESYLQIPCF